MVCKKCNYKDKKEKNIFGTSLCQICSKFSPKKIHDFQKYIEEKIDWKVIDSFRSFNQGLGQNQKEGMAKRASSGNPVSRAPLGYEILEGNLFPNEDASKVHSIFKTFLNRVYSLNSMAKNFSLSTNGIKKILTNRTYLGEIKFNGRIHKGHHQTIISPELFYAVQRKLKDQLRPRK
jgi:site-specific DNA recombinase